MHATANYQINLKFYMKDEVVNNYWVSRSGINQYNEVLFICINPINRDYFKYIARLKVALAKSANILLRDEKFIYTASIFISVCVPISRTLVDFSNKILNEVLNDF